MLVFNMRFCGRTATRRFTQLFLVLASLCEAQSRLRVGWWVLPLHIPRPAPWRGVRDISEARGCSIPVVLHPECMQIKGLVGGASHPATKDRVGMLRAVRVFATPECRSTCSLEGWPMGPLSFYVACGARAMLTGSPTVPPQQDAEFTSGCAVWQGGRCFALCFGQLLYVQDFRSWRRT